MSPVHAGLSVTFCAISLSVLSCAGSHKSTASSEVVVPANMPPSQCLIGATVVQIDTSLMRDDPQGVCAKYPCKAKVKVNKLYGCGAGVVELPEEGKEINIYFAHSLHATKDAVPGLTVHYPGLENGSSFTASVIQQQALGGVSYTIDDYKKNKPTK